MIIIYDLDKTSLYCPIADFMDKFIPSNMFLKKIYYSLYPFVHILEMKLGLLKINKEMYIRAKQYNEFEDCHQIVITARHKSRSLALHVAEVFKDVPITTFAIAQGLTYLHKVDVIDQLPMYEDEEIIMYDDNIRELKRVCQKYNKHFTGIQVDFTGEKEEILTYVS